ncbi:MAG: hypothetical protein KKA28_08840 [Planctomycetes bacterium]|nr:hypothetical protein [Planctomycetota bacterium]MCG2682496.1 hypothetical protein [Planctomycetales bacterium]
MTTTSSQEHVDSYRLCISRYDRVSSLLISLLILIGSLVSILLIAWLTSKIFVSQAAVPVELADFSGDDGPVGGGQTPEPPNPEEIREMEIEEPVITETLTTISSVVQKQVPMLDDPMIAHKKTSGMGFGHGEGRGRGDGVGDGSGGSSRGWEVRFDKGATLDVYARQLDFFKIELGVLLPDGRLVYAKNFSKPRPDVRYVNNPSEKEKRYYLTWRKGGLQQADRELLAKAGINVGKNIILKFLLPALEQRLVALERAYAAGRDPKSIRRTRFGVRSDGDGYAFFVLDQSYKR